MTTTSPQVQDLPKFDPLLTDPTRLLIAAALVRPASHRVDEVADAVGVKRVELLGHLRRLREAGYVNTYRDERRCTWANLTGAGEKRLVEHLQALRVLISQVDTLVLGK